MTKDQLLTTLFRLFCAVIMSTKKSQSVIFYCRIIFSFNPDHTVGAKLYIIL